MKKFTRLWQFSVVLIMAMSIVTIQAQESKQKPLPEKRVSAAATQTDASYLLQEAVAFENEYEKEIQTEAQEQLNAMTPKHADVDPNFKPPTGGTADAVGDLLQQFDLEAITANGDILFLGAEFFGGHLWVTSRADVLGAPSIYEIDPSTNTVVNIYPQGTTTVWGMRDLASDGTYLYASDEDGFYQIDPTDGTVTTVFDNTAPIFSTVSPLRALAFDGTNFWAKSFGGDLAAFDMAGNLVAGPYALTNSSYGACFDGTWLWLHATSQVSAEPTEMVQIDPTTGLVTGTVVGIPDAPCPVGGIVGGAFFDDGNLIPGRTIFGGLLQGAPDVIHIVEHTDNGYPGQSSNHIPACGAIGVPTDGDLTWDFGAGTTTYDLWFGPLGAMTQVVTGGAAGASGSYTFAGLTGETDYSWQLIQTNATGNTTSLLYTFTTAAPPITTFPAFEDFETFVTATNATGYQNNWAASPENTTSVYRWNVDAGGTPSSGTGPTVDHTTGTSTGIYIFTEASSGDAGDVAYLYTPLYDLSGLATAQIEFWYHMYGVIMGELHLDINDGSGWVNDVMTPLIGQQQANQTDPYLQMVVNLDSYVGQTVQFRFRGISGGFWESDMAIDDVTVGEVPACPSPDNLGATNITTTSADLTFNSFTGDSNLEWGPAGFAQGSGTLVNNVTSPYALGSLSEYTFYEFYVQDNCGGDVSPWAGPFEFNTLCDVVCPPGAIPESEACGLDLNGGCNMPVPAFEPVPSGGGVICGTLWADAGSRDTDWYEIVLTESSTVQMDMEAEGSYLFGLIEQAQVGCPGGCANITGFIDPVGFGQPCEWNTISVNLPAGTYYFFAGLDVFEGYPCDVDYYAEFTVTPYTPNPGEFCSTAIPASPGMNSAPGQPIWHMFTGNDELVTVTSCLDGQSIDTHIQVFDGCCGNLIAESDDNGCAFYSFASTVEFFAESGITYYFRWLDTWSTDPFDFEIISGLPVADISDLGGYYPNIVEDATASAYLNVGNTGNYPLNYTAEVDYPGALMTVPVYPQSVALHTGTTDGTTYTENSLVKGYGATSDGYMIFDVSSIPDGAMITNIEFNGYVYETNWPYWSVTPCYLDPLTTTAADLRTHIGTFSASADAYYYGNEASGFAPGWKVHDLVGTANADMEAALTQDWFAVGVLERDGSDTYFLSFEGWNETNVPFLNVTYQTAPIGWLSVDGGPSAAGTALPGDPPNMHMLDFDATGFAPGSYIGAINIMTNEPPTDIAYTVPVVLTVVAGPGYDVSGVLEYPRLSPPNTPLDNVTVTLWESNIMMGSATTDVGGAFTIGSIPDGSYNYSAMTTKPVDNAVNVGDALSLRVGLNPGGSLTPEQLFAGDVAAPTGTNIGDVYQIRVFLTPGTQTGEVWLGPEWKFTDPSIDVSGGNATVDFNGVVSGDVLLNHIVAPGDK